MTISTLALVTRGASETEFLAVFSRLCVALREPQDDSGITQQVYWDALSDLPIQALEQGAAALMRQRGRKFFPTTAEWRGEAETAQFAHLKQAVGGREEPWRHDCHECEDTGWIMGLSCDGGMSQWPEQGQPHTNVGPQPGEKHHHPWVYRADERASVKPRSASCGKTTPHVPHVYTQPCPCRVTNATYRRHQAFGGGAS